MPAGQWRAVSIGGLLGIPTAGVSAVSVDFLALNHSAAGYLKADKNEPTPNTTVPYMSWTASVTQSNNGVVAVGADGKIQVMATTSTDLVIDVEGYYTAGDPAAGGFVPVSQTRIVDTRVGLGLPAGKLAVGSTSTVQVTGTAGVPADASAVMLSFTVLDQSASSYLQPYPADGVRPQPFMSFGNAGPDVTSAPVELSSQGAIKIYEGNATIDLVIDVVGYFTAVQSGTAFTPAQARVYDSRSGTNTPLGGGASRTIQVAGIAGVPASGISAVAVDVIVLDQGGTSGGYLRAWPGGTPEPNPSHAIAYTAGQTAANMLTLELGAGGDLTIHNRNADSIDVVLDVEGWYSNDDVKDNADKEPAVAPPTYSGGTVIPEGATQQVSGTFTNAAGVPAANLQVILYPLNTDAGTDATSESSPVNVDALGSTNTDSAGHWTYTLPTPLPPAAQATADANGGVLNLSAEVYGKATDGTALYAQSTVSSVSGQSVANGIATDQSNDTVDPVAGAAALHVLSPAASVAPPSDQVVQASPAQTTYDAVNAGTLTDPVVPQWQSLDSVSSAYQPDTVNGVDYGTASLQPAYTYCRKALVKTASTVVYTTVGETHSYYNGWGKFTYTRSLSSSFALGFSYDAKHWTTSGNVKLDNTTTLSASTELRGPYQSYEVQIPIKYTRNTWRNDCVDDSIGNPTKTFYTYTVAPRGYSLPVGWSPIRLGRDVSYKDGYQQWAASKWYYTLDRGESTQLDGGRSTTWGVAASAFGFSIGVSTQMNTQHSQYLKAGYGRYEHDWFTTNGPADGSHPGVICAW